MKNFSTKEPSTKRDMVFYLDLHDNTIKCGSIRDVGTIEDYYSQYAEYKLGRFESDFGEVVCKIRTFGKSNTQSLKLGEKDYKRIKNYIAYSIARSENFLKSANNRSTTSKILGSFSSDVFISLLNFESMKYPFENYRINFIDNESGTQFIVPRNCIYSIYPVGKLPRIILPISPFRAIILVNETEFDECFVNGEQCYYRIDNAELIRQFNTQAYLTERSINNSFVVAKRKDELAELIIEISRIDLAADSQLNHNIL